LIGYIALALAAVTFMLLTRYRDPGIIPRGLEFSHNPGAQSLLPLLLVPTLIVLARSRLTRSLHSFSETVARVHDCGGWCARATDNPWDYERKKPPETIKINVHGESLRIKYCGTISQPATLFAVC
jgi:hypothetical protein